jgi:hypothetical protein
MAENAAKLTLLWLAQMAIRSIMAIASLALGRFRGLELSAGFPVGIFRHWTVRVPKLDRQLGVTHAVLFGEAIAAPAKAPEERLQVGLGDFGLHGGLLWFAVADD